jgi:hypothetical protein
MPFPTLQGESRELEVQFALLLLDGVTNSGDLVGEVTVTSGTIGGEQKNSSGTFLFNGLKTGPLSFAVTCGIYTPYYLPTTINITLPMTNPLWPAYPDKNIANETLPLGDPGQTAAYIAQRQAATLLPTTQYPFLPGTTLIRGTVLHTGQPLAGATVQEASGSDPGYITSADGTFVLFLSNPPGLPEQVTVNATAAGLPAASGQVTVMRGLTVSLTINM